MRLRSKPIPPEVQEFLRTIPKEFKDDGLSWCPDSLFGFNFRWAGRIHDYRYCTRCWPGGSMTQAWRHMADEEIKFNVRSALPRRHRWFSIVVYIALWRYGGVSAFDSCGPEVGERCRHNMTRPVWMPVRSDGTPFST